MTARRRAASPVRSPAPPTCRSPRPTSCSTPYPRPPKSTMRWRGSRRWRASPASLRELAEETNITSVDLLAEAPDWFFYDLPPELVPHAWGGRYRGQKQKWYALRFTGPESEIDVEHPAGGHAPEFSQWRWVPMRRLPDLIIPFKRSVYEQVVATFANLSPSA